MTRAVFGLLLIEVTALRHITALAAVLGLTAAQLASSAHVEAEHVVCPEHGEAIHHAGGPQQGDTVAHVATVPAPEDEHELHCGAVFVASDLPFEVTVLPAALPSSRVRTLPRAEAFSFRPLAYAPKTSPPMA